MQAALVMTVTSWMSPLESRVKSNANCGAGGRGSHSRRQLYLFAQISTVLQVAQAAGLTVHGNTPCFKAKLRASHLLTGM